MKLIKTERVCVKCKVSKAWTDYEIEWAPTWEMSYVRRTCSACEAGVADKKAEARLLQAELKKLAKKRVDQAGRLDDIDATIAEKLLQLSLFK